MGSRRSTSLKRPVTTAVGLVTTGLPVPVTTSSMFSRRVAPKEPRPGAELGTACAVAFGWAVPDAAVAAAPLTAGTVAAAGVTDGSATALADCGTWDWMT